MRETGGGDYSPSEGETASATDERKEKRFLDSTSTTYGATERLRLDDDDLRLFTTRAVLGGGGGPPPLALLAVPPTIPSAPINSHELPLYSSSPVPSAPQQACPTPSTSPTPLPPCTRCVTCASSTYFVTRGPPSPALIPLSPPNG